MISWICAAHGFYACGGERSRCQGGQPLMGGRIREQHLLYRHLRNGTEGGQA